MVTFKWNTIQEAQLLQRDCAMLPVIEYFTESLKIIQNDNFNQSVSIGP